MIKDLAWSTFKNTGNKYFPRIYGIKKHRKKYRNGN